MLRTRAPKMSRTANQRGPPADGGRRISAARSAGNLSSGTQRAVASILSPKRRGQSARSTRGKPVRREPSSRSELADALLACAFDDRTDAAFDAGTRGVVSLSDLLEPVLGPPYAGRRFTSLGLRRGDEDSLIGDGPPKGTARQRARSLTRARRAEQGTDLSTGNIGEISLKFRNAARADFVEFLRTSSSAPSVRMRRSCSSLIRIGRLNY